MKPKADDQTADPAKPVAPAKAPAVKAGPSIMPSPSPFIPPVIAALGEAAKPARVAPAGPPALADAAAVPGAVKQTLGPKQDATMPTTGIPTDVQERLGLIAPAEKAPTPASPDQVERFLAGIEAIKAKRAAEAAEEAPAAAPPAPAAAPPAREVARAAQDPYAAARESLQAARSDPFRKATFLDALEAALAGFVGKEGAYSTQRREFIARQQALEDEAARRIQDLQDYAAKMAMEGEVQEAQRAFQAAENEKNRRAERELAELDRQPADPYAGLMAAVQQFVGGGK